MRRPDAEDADEFVADFLGDLQDFLVRHPLEVVWRGDSAQERRHGHPPRRACGQSVGSAVPAGDGADEVGERPAGRTERLDGRDRRPVQLLRAVRGSRPRRTIPDTSVYRARRPCPLACLRRPPDRRSLTSRRRSGTPVRTPWRSGPSARERPGRPRRAVPPGRRSPRAARRPGRARRSSAGAALPSRPAWSAGPRTGTGPRRPSRASARPPCRPPRRRGPTPGRRPPPSAADSRPPAPRTPP